MTLFHLIAGNGSLTIDNVSVLQPAAYMGTSQVASLHANGHEIGAHTRTHTSLVTLSTAEKETEIAGSRQDLIVAGFAPVDTLAYPFGEYDAEAQTIAAASGLTLARSVLRGYNDSTTDPYALRIQQVGRNRTLDEMKGWIDQASASKTWLIFMFHQISNDVTDTYGITQSDFSALVDHAVAADVDHITVREGAALLTP
jgi:peptidoglycan/xylan/chitin deacetylase (PgdA/CDA1 family)